MGFYPFKLSLADKTTGAPITTYTQLNLRRAPYSVAAYSQLSQSGGTYEFGNIGTPVLSGDYKLYDDATELTAFGIIRVGEPDAVLSSTDQSSLSGAKGWTGVHTFATGCIINTALTINADTTVLTGHPFLVADAPTVDTGVVRKIDIDSKAGLDSANEFSANNNFIANVSFDNDPPTCSSPPISPASLVNQQYIQDIVESIEVIPFQESSNNRRLIVNGIQDTNKVYKTWTACQNNARQYATSNWRITIEVKGAGESSNDITVTDGSVPGNKPFNDFVNVKGDNQGIKLQVSDESYVLAALGNSIIENIAIESDDNGTGTPTFENFVFKDVYFNFDTSSIGFVNCKFLGNCYVKNTGTISFDGNCKGGYVATNGAITAKMFGIDGLATGDF